MTFIVALTGGIGSGKSTIAQFFADCGAPIIDADIISRELVAPSEDAFKKIVERFGEAIVDKNGEIDRKALREIIFNQPDDKAWLEGLLHPAVFRKVLEKIKIIKYPYCIVVIPLLAEHYDKYRDLASHVLVIDTTEEHQLAWTAIRDHCSQSLIKKMISAQASREQRNKIADTLLINNASLEDLKNKIIDLHQLFLKKM